MNWSQQITEELQPYYRIRHELSIFDEGCLAHGKRAVIPKELQQRVMHLAHEGHPGIVKNETEMSRFCMAAVN